MKDKQIDLHRGITVIISIVWMAFQTYIILGLFIWFSLWRSSIFITPLTRKMKSFVN